MSTVGTEENIQLKNSMLVQYMFLIQTLQLKTVMPGIYIRMNAMNR
jgi:hypothetical protein